jgi:hypothetical protein
MSSVSPRCAVEVPEKQSVRKLKEWLNNFGEQHRQHFEKNQLRAPMGKVGYRIYSIEKRLSASASFDSSSTTNDGASSFTAEAYNAPGDARRGNVTGSWARDSPIQSIERAPSDEMLLSPIDPEGTNQLMPIVINHEHPVAKDVLSWHPNARTAAGVRQYDDVHYDDDDFLDSVSIQTGRYTDPGANATWSSTRTSSTSSRMRMVAKVPLPPRFSKDDLAMATQSRSKSCRIHPKQFLCISPQTDSRDESNQTDSYSCERDPPEVGVPCDGLPLYSSSSDRVALLDTCQSASTSRNESPDNVFSSAWSTASDPTTLTIRSVGVLDTRLSRIFAEETDKMNRQAVLNAQHGVGHRHSSLVNSQDQREVLLSREGVLPPATAGRALRKSAIESRKEELQRKWAENRPTSHVKKVSWQVSNKGGGYKKKVYLDYN